MTDRTRTLVGGPRDGETHTWPEDTELETMHMCPSGDPLALDTSRYDTEGRYRWSTHPGEPIIERLDDCCDLCPGHITGRHPDERYDWSDHERQNA